MDISKKMVTVKSKALDTEVRIKREIGRYGNVKNGPTVVFFAGIHGNEPSGIFALKNVFRHLEKQRPEFNGNVVALSGNLAALERGERFIKDDLNRVWQSERVEKIKNGTLDIDEILPDINQQIDIYRHIETIFKNHPGPYYFIDLHTTSADSVPFITLNDTLRNRNFALKFPVPIILGIEEFLNGPLMSYINELGPIAMGFEAGSHDDIQSIMNHESCVWLALSAVGCMDKKRIPDYQHHYDLLAGQSIDGKRVFEIRFRYDRKEDEGFVMKPGFQNFQPIKKDTLLAHNNNGPIYAVESGRMFLPLYQEKGDDGFFIIREIKWFWLVVSAWLRKYHFGRLLRWLPGITVKDNHVRTFKINAKVARWLVLEIFHLLGYRRVGSHDKYHYFTRRKFDINEPRHIL